MNKPAKHPTPRQRRQDRLIHEWVHDPYQSKRKLPDPTVCPQCGAACHRGRRTWLTRPKAAHEELCPACHCIVTKTPPAFSPYVAGFWTAPLKIF